MQSRRYILASFALLALTSLAFASTSQQTKGGPPLPNPNAGEWAGTYGVKVTGEYTGTGDVDVNSAKKLFIKLKVKDSSGATRNFNASNLDIGADGHFTGTGTISGGLKVTVQGRFDAPAAGQNWKMRFCCNYTDANGKSGRIIGIKAD